MTYRFLDFELDTDTQELRKAGMPAAIEPQVYDLLLYLIENRDRLISHDELIAQVWRGRIVADATIASRIRAVRNVLGDTGAEQAFIQTAPKRGFRFVAPMAETPPESGGQRQAASGIDPIEDAPDKPSIAVLPFSNLSDDPNQEYLADGIAEDVITALSRFHSLFVIARSSSFTYKGQAVDIAQAAGELAVRYVVEGSVRKAGNRVRISAQLIDAKSGAHLWADRYEGTLDDVFDLQDQVTQQIIAAVEPEVGSRERTRARRKRPEDLDAWSFLQRGLSHFYRINEADNAEAIRLLREATKADPDFALAHAYLAYATWSSVSLGYAKDKFATVALAREAAKRALSLDSGEPIAHFALGRAYAFEGEAELAIEAMRTAIDLNPNLSWGHMGLGISLFFGAGEAERAMPHFDVALRLSPRDPLRWGVLMVKGSALRFLGHLDEAIQICRQASQIPDCGYMPFMNLAAAWAAAGKLDEAHAAAENMLQLQPGTSIGDLRQRFAGMHDTVWDGLRSDLQKAGLPE